jgi:ATP-dependent Clp protease ATP-binding subunit ClpB
MTSNVGSTAIFELAHRDPERARKEAMEALRAAFRPEFINRIDEIVIFNPLGKEQLERIVDLLLRGVEQLLAERQITMELTPAPLALQILDSKVLPGDHIRVDRDGKSDSMRFERVQAKKPAAA